MRSRDWLLGSLTIGFFGAIAAAGVLAWQVRSLYERELVQQVWPPGSGEASIVKSPGGGSEPTLLLLGDSRIGQWNLPRPTSGRIVQAGFPGATTSRIASETPELLARYRPDIVVVEAGINDLKLSGMRPDLREKIVETAASNLERIVDLSISAHSQVLLLLVWPASEPDLLRRFVWNTVVVSSSVDALNKRLRDLNTPTRGVFVLDLFSEAGGAATYRDTLHLAPGTYDRLTPILEREIDRMRSGAMSSR